MSTAVLECVVFSHYYDLRLVEDLTLVLNVFVGEIRAVDVW